MDEERYYSLKIEEHNKGEVTGTTYATLTHEEYEYIVNYLMREE